MEDEVLDMIADADLDAQADEYEQGDDPMMEYQDEAMEELARRAQS